ncbi:hypothetical protein O3P69_018029 [Scylla paramamosain]|uniref:Uncharacterized protein n=1 Tax=Scylla paramamosain TaxID=85552 RepID=A0AAW0TIH2_SCYPA
MLTPVGSKALDMPFQDLMMLNLCRAVRGRRGSGGGGSGGSGRSGSLFLFLLKRQPILAPRSQVRSPRHHLVEPLSLFSLRVPKPAGCARLYQRRCLALSRPGAAPPSKSCVTTTTGADGKFSEDSGPAQAKKGHTVHHNASCPSSPRQRARKASSAPINLALSYTFPASHFRRARTPPPPLARHVFLLPLPDRFTQFGTTRVPVVLVLVEAEVKQVSLCHQRLHKGPVNVHDAHLTPTPHHARDGLEQAQSPTPHPSISSGLPLPHNTGGAAPNDRQPACQKIKTKRTQWRRGEGVLSVSYHFVISGLSES